MIRFSPNSLSLEIINIDQSSVSSPLPEDILESFYKEFVGLCEGYPDLSNNIKIFLLRPIVVIRVLRCLLTFLLVYTLRYEPEVEYSDKYQTQGGEVDGVEPSFNDGPQ